MNFTALDKKYEKKWQELMAEAVSQEKEDERLRDIMLSNYDGKIENAPSEVKKQIKDMQDRFNKKYLLDGQKAKELAIAKETERQKIIETRLEIEKIFKSNGRDIYQDRGR